MKKAKTSIFAFLQKAFQLAQTANKSDGLSEQEIIEMAQQKAASRRKFLENSGKTLLTGGILASMASCWATSS